jgi:hypothetical protein
MWGFTLVFMVETFRDPILKIVIEKTSLSKQALRVISPIPLSMIRLLLHCNLEVITKLQVHKIFDSGQKFLGHNYL